MPFLGTIWANHRTPGETGLATVPHCHCEAVGRGNLQYHVSARMEPINIVYPRLSMLIYIPAHPTAAVEIATVADAPSQ